MSNGKPMSDWGMRSLIFLLVLTPVLTRAGGNEVVIVYNTRMSGSRSVADYYAKMRQVPPKQIYGFALPTGEIMSRDEFRDVLQLPLARRLESDGLWQFGPVTGAATNAAPLRVERRVVASKIRYLVLCYGVPLKIAPDPELNEPFPRGAKPELNRNEAAVDSELAWLPLVEENFPLAGPLPNWTYGSTNVRMLNPTNGILLVARLDGPNATIAKGLVDKALEAERDGLWGRAYFDMRGLGKADVYYPGDQWMAVGAEICRDLGFDTTVDDKPETFSMDFPMSQIAIYCGWYDGNVSGPFTLPKVEFMPGAFAYHLHSFSAATLRSENQNWCGPLLAKGAACTMGCVYEPYLTGTQNIAAFLARWLADGFTFGEAAWGAQPVLSWQTTVIGDPLYRPSGKSASFLHAELVRRHSPLVEWSQLHIVDQALVHGASIYVAANYLENISTTTNSAVLTEKLADLYESEGKPASAIDMYEQALKLGPSPEQRIHLRLTLGEKLEQHDQDQEAYDNYQELLQEATDYPGKISIYQKLLALARKLNKPDDVARYELLIR